jgi:hypothetical protein
MRRSFRVALWLFGAAVAASLVIGGGAAIVVWHNTTLSRASAKDVEQEFARIRARFPPRPALLEIGDPIKMAIRVNRPPESAPRQRVQAFNVLAWDGRNERLVRSRAPVWWMRQRAEPGLGDWLPLPWAHGRRRERHGQDRAEFGAGRRPHAGVVQ